MKHCILFVFSFLIISCSPKIPVLTYNIYHGESPYNKGQSNLSEIAILINKLDPDVVFLQEVDSMTHRTATVNNGVKKDVAKELGLLTHTNGYFSKAIDYSGGGYGEGILVKKSTEIIRMQLPNPQGGEGRALIATKGKVGDKWLIYTGTHLCHQYQVNRMAQVRSIVEYYQRENLPMILGGDFNFEPDSEEYRYITQFFYDAAVLGGKTENTFSSEKPDIRIDFLFLSKNSKWKVKEIRTITTMASDHLPLFGIFKLR